MLVKLKKSSKKKDVPWFIFGIVLLVVIGGIISLFFSSPVRQVLFGKAISEQCSSGLDGVCPAGCSVGNDVDCSSSSSSFSSQKDCAANWKCKDALNRGYQKADCSWINVEVCLEGCVNLGPHQGVCKAVLTPRVDIVSPIVEAVTSTLRCADDGWSCQDNFNKGNKNADCSWKDVTNCPYGCYDGKCNAALSLVMPGYKCKDSSTRAYQRDDGSWIYPENCLYGCHKGYCKPTLTTCTTGWKCQSTTQVGHQFTNCNWGYVQHCQKGCFNGPFGGQCVT